MLFPSVDSNIRDHISTTMADTKTVFREGWVQISKDHLEGFYPAVTLLAPEKYCTDPYKPISIKLPNGSDREFEDFEAKDQLRAKIKPSTGDNSEEFFEEVQVRAMLRLFNKRAHVYIFLSG